MGSKFRFGATPVLALSLCACQAVKDGDAAASATQSPHPPLIEMHLHAESGTTQQSWSDVLRGLREHAVMVSVLSVWEMNVTGHWAESAGIRFLAGPSFPCYEGRRPRSMEPCFAQTGGWPDLAWLRTQYESDRMHIMGELLYVYSGIPPTDGRLAPYWALAEELDIPVGVHVGRGPFRRPEGCCPDFNDDLGNPLLLEPVLRRHPALRVWLMHAAGWDYLDETITLMKSHPNVYAELSIVNSVAPAQMHTDALRALLDAGLGDRIMFGSDNMPIGPILERIEAIPFLSEAQKRAIYHDNAARFLRISEENGIVAPPNLAHQRTSRALRP